MAIADSASMEDISANRAKHRERRFERLGCTGIIASRSRRRPIHGAA